MTDFDPRPSDGAVEARRKERWADTDTFGRVYDAVVGTSALTSYGDLAEVADCSPNAAKKHLDRLAELGIVRADTESRPARYARNDGYFQWLEASTIARDLREDEILDRVERLEARREEFEERFDATDPAAVSAVDVDDHEAIHERMAALTEWRAIERDLGLYDLARRLAANDGQLLPA